MPKFLEDKLKREYAAKGKSGKALAHAVFGTMNAIGAMHGSKITAKGERMEAKHEKKGRGGQRNRVVTEHNAYDWRKKPRRGNSNA